MDKVLEPSNSECYAPSLEPFRFSSYRYSLILLNAEKIDRDANSLAEEQMRVRSPRKSERTLLCEGDLYQTSEAKVKLSLCLINYALRHEYVWGSGCIDRRFLDHGTSCR
jgi:hypothetical protein